MPFASSSKITRAERFLKFKSGNLIKLFDHNPLNSATKMNIDSFSFQIKTFESEGKSFWANADTSQQNIPKMVGRIILPVFQASFVMVSACVALLMYFDILL